MPAFGATLHQPHLPPGIHDIGGESAEKDEARHSNHANSTKCDNVTGICVSVSVLAYILEAAAPHQPSLRQ